MFSIIPPYVSSLHGPRIRRKRPALRLVISSATLDATSFLEYFNAGVGPNEAIIASLEGRMFPVEVAYSEEPCPDYVRKAADVACQINVKVKNALLSKQYGSNIVERGWGYLNFPHWT
jgi:HrpA-like RNA helicase